MIAIFGILLMVGGYARCWHIDITRGGMPIETRNGLRIVILLGSLLTVIGIFMAASS